MKNKGEKFNRSGNLILKKFVIILVVAILISGLGILIFYNKDKVGGYVIKNERPDPIDTLTVPIDNTDDEQMPEEKLEELKETEEYKSFASSCGGNGGSVLITTESGSVTYECYQKSDDAGSNCRTDSDCGSYNCNLQAAVDSGACILIKTDKNFTEKTYVYTYSCSSNKPGVCGEIPRNMPVYYWVGDNVIEYGEKSFPEEDEFKPV